MSLELKVGLGFLVMVGALIFFFAGTNHTVVEVPPDCYDQNHSYQMGQGVQLTGRIRRVASFYMTDTMFFQRYDVEVRNGVPTTQEIHVVVGSRDWHRRNQNAYPLTGPRPEFGIRADYCPPVIQKVDSIPWVILTEPIEP